MELRHLRYFAGVADELNFTRAARKLRVAQPALSRQIRQLEEELGVRLLERTPRGVRLTNAGKAFLGEARALLRQSEEAVRVAQQHEPAGGLLRLGYIWGLFHAFVPPLLARFRQHHPATAVHLFDLMPLEQVEALKEGRLDAGFVGFADEAEGTGLSKRKVGTCRFVVALPQGHRATAKARVPLASLADELFLGISDRTYPGASGHVTRACQRAGFRPRTVQMVERGYTILGLVSAGCGIAMVPESLKALPHPGIKFRPLADPPTADLFLAWKGEGSALLGEFLKVLETHPPFRSAVGRFRLKVEP